MPIRSWSLRKPGDLTIRRSSMDNKTARRRTGAFALALMLMVALVNGPAVRDAFSDDGPDYLILNPEAD